MVAAGEMDIDGLGKGQPRLDMGGDLQRMALGVGGGKLAAFAAGACDQPGADRMGRYRQAKNLDGGNGGGDLRIRHPREQQVLPDCQADVAIAELEADLR